MSQHPCKNNCPNYRDEACGHCLVPDSRPALNSQLNAAGSLNGSYGCTHAELPLEQALWQQNNLPVSHAG